ncbi:MAG: hypothetical protein U0414_25505 [Polyangiaceae bacterium]
MNTKLFAGALGLLVLGLASGCDDSSGSGGAGGSTTSSSTKATTGASMTTGTTTGSSMSTGSSMVTLDCNSYCGEVMKNCTGANAQYTDMPSCLAMCATFPVGTLADTSGNTLGCRLYHGGAPAAGMPNVHCAHAGPLGADKGTGTCGDPCDSFCTEAHALCATQWPDVAACKTECMKFTDNVSYNTAATAGDTLACREYHLMAASTSPVPHCDHTLPASDPKSTQCK